MLGSDSQDGPAASNNGRVLRSGPHPTIDRGRTSEGLLFSGSVQRGTFLLDIAFDLQPGKVLGVLGPNGSGKTTLLRALAGLDPLETGELWLDGNLLDSPDQGVFVKPRKRRVGVLFQDYRLFPHLKVRDNVAYGPRSVGVPRADARAAAQRWLERFGLGDYADRKPAQLSGGQAQRVALARALATDPQLLVFDEPLAALDSRTRLDVRTELRDHLEDFEGPVVLVTHDPVEAMVMTDELLVIEAGRVVQRGTPAEVAARPLTDYVARLVGLNLYEGTTAGSEVRLDRGGSLVVVSDDADRPSGQPADGTPRRVFVAVRPEAIAVYTDRPGPGSPRNVWPARVRALDVVGARVRLHLEGEPPAIVDVTAAAVAELGLRSGVEVWCAVKATELVVYDA